MKKTLTVAAVALIAAAGCGNGSKANNTASTGGSTTTGNSTTGTAGGGATDGFGGRGGGASGLLAEIDGKTLQVQSTSSQTAVTYTGTTTFTTQQAATAADVKVGVCVTVRPVDTGSTATTAPSTDTNGPIDAAAVTITAPGSDGTCGFGGGNGGTFRGGAFPSGAFPSRRFGGGAFPSGAPGGRRFGGFGATGKVTAVSATGFTVASITPRFRANGSTAPTAVPTAAPTAVSTTPVTVVTSSTTTYTEDVKATAAALKVGTCVRARGAADSSTGTVTATSIAITPATNGSCDTGFGGGGFGGPGGAPAGGGSNG
ncbi:MAG TPA: hypothetical protein VHE83_12555 [Mycobacteriales bacterium]|nr:hypothetical protein [Mycobacteriales bacterium]